MKGAKFRQTDLIRKKTDQFVNIKSHTAHFQVSWGIFVLFEFYSFYQILNLLLGYMIERLWRNAIYAIL